MRHPLEFGWKGVHAAGAGRRDLELWRQGLQKK
jgi:hypothetical protein